MTEEEDYINAFYIKTFDETLDSIYQLMEFLDSKQEIKQIKNYLSQILTKAVAKIDSSSGKTTKYWEAVLDAVKSTIERITVHKDPEKFIFEALDTKKPVRNLFDRMGGFTRTGLSPTPFVYNFPYPKAPPVASAEAHLKTKKKIPEDHPSAPLYQELKDSPFFREFLIKQGIITDEE